VDLLQYAVYISKEPSQRHLLEMSLFIGVFLN